MNQNKIGKFLAELRNEKKLTQSQVAEKFGVSDKTISRWENGKNLPDISMFDSICEFFGVTLEELISGERIEKNQDKEIEIDQEEIVKKYKLNQSIKKNKRVRIVTAVVLAFLLFLSLELKITTSLVFASCTEANLWRDLHYDIDVICNTLSVVSLICAMILFIALLATGRIYRYLCKHILAVVCISLLVVSAIVIARVEMNYKYNEPYLAFDIERGGDTKEDEPYKNDLMFFPYHEEIKGTIDLENGESLLENLSFNLYEYSLFGTRYIYTDEYGINDDKDFCSIEYFKTDCGLAKEKQNIMLLKNFDDACANESEFLIQKENCKLYKWYYSYTLNGYMAVVKGEDDCLIFKVTPGDKIDENEQNIVNKALETYKVINTVPEN